MPRLFGIPGTSISVIVNTRDHCPPHVHVEPRAGQWEARMEFNFLDGSVGLMDMMPPDRAPTLAILNAVRVEFAANLGAARRAWWAIYADACLDNRWLIPARTTWRDAGNLRAPPAQQVRGAAYDPVADVLTISWTNGATSTVQL